ncbi:hypothetical protein BJV78DRAFT_1175779 [Lactifluus subvellereus]|nr:hypothetical protein BJV78DRAFT_1175779 [Lactifluus subvellereus]
MIRTMKGYLLCPPSGNATNSAKSLSKARRTVVKLRVSDVSINCKRRGTVKIS